MFIARNRFAVLDKGSNQILVKNLRNEITKKCAAPCASTDAIFYAGTGTLLCRSDDKVGSCLKKNKKQRKQCCWEVVESSAAWAVAGILCRSFLHNLYQVLAQCCAA